MMMMMILACIVTGFLLLSTSLADLPPVRKEWQGRQYACKCSYTDDCWASEATWADLNSTVEGNLHVHIPPEAACHDTFDGPFGSVSTYDADQCAQVRANYADVEWR